MFAWHCPWPGIEAGSPAQESNIITTRPPLPHPVSSRSFCYLYHLPSCWDQMLQFDQNCAILYMAGTSLLIPSVKVIMPPRLHEDYSSPSFHPYNCKRGLRHIVLVPIVSNFSLKSSSKNNKNYGLSLLVKRGQMVCSGVNIKQESFVK